jgi:hypothetical protein
VALTRRKVKIVRPEDVPPDQTWVYINGQDEELPATMGEADFQVLCEQTAIRYGWTVYHETDSRKSPKGLPDLIMLSRPSPEGVVVLAMIELKTNKGKPTNEQEVWLTKLALTTTLVTGLLRPQDWRRFVQLCFDPHELAS